MKNRLQIHGMGHVQDAKGGWVVVVFDGEGEAHPVFRIRPDGHAERMPDLPHGLGLHRNKMGQIMLADVR